ncbi:hypothetical protein F960_01817 [Acinetobacter gerneri DSM 14967 = CIP 107464 = MTCC 9824]|uniref:DUF2345 domain-containing protein n=1 Tax=Acinetobacter gerneri DSM 14967 = CIP 107464 = MTCC 9824 TaxID=1120926 RepID=N8YBI9_9GAMM|nr:hypothetical protein F960_01817 [Acinetobacter gerneri DSM 14967 = CIP 107464 = MTCC 9824]
MGAIRAGAGLLLSTYRQDQAKGDHLNAEEAKKQLDHNYDQIKSLDKTAKELESTPLDVLENLKKFIEQLSKEDESKAEAFKSAIVILASPKSIGLSSEEDIHSVAKGFILHSAGKSINISTQNSFLAQASKKLSLLAAREDASFIAGLGKVLIKASSNVLDIIARKDIHMSSKEGKVYVTSPTELILTGGSSQICIKDAGIFSKTGGLYESKAGQHLFKSGEKVNKTEFGHQLYDLKVQLFNQETQQAVPSRKYKMILSDGSVLEGETDENCFTETALSAKQLKIDSIDYSDE